MLFILCKLWMFIVIVDSIATNEAQTATIELVDTNHTIELTRPRNNYAEIKALINHIADGLSKRFDTIDAVLLNELSTLNQRINSVEGSLRHLNERFESLEMISRQIDELADHQNAIDIDLAQLKSTQDINQLINNKINEIKQTVDGLKNHLEQSEYINERNANKNNNNGNDISNVNENIVDNIENCESKIDELISFVHNFGEINRLESSDILTRLSNMQTQLIHFFDAYKGSSKAQSVLHAQTFINKTFNEYFEQTNNNVPYTENVLENISNKTDVKQNNNDSNNINNDNNIALNMTNADVTKERIARGISNRYRLSPAQPLPWHRNTMQRSARYEQPSPYGCHQFENIQRTDGFYRFDSLVSNQNDAGRSINERICSFDATGLAWTVIQKRTLTSNLENFNRSWSDYKNGFGQLDENGEFWFGNDFIHRLTYDDDMELKIILEDWNNRKIEFIYDVFRVDSEANKYNLIVDDFHGENNTLNAMAYHNGQDFSTYDRQNDKTGIDGNRTCCSCAVSYASGWWFNNCLEANLNGIYRMNATNNNFVGIVWEQWLGDYSLKSTKMMVRPKVNWFDSNANTDDGIESIDP